MAFSRNWIWWHVPGFDRAPRIITYEGPISTLHSYTVPDGWPYSDHAQTAKSKRSHAHRATIRQHKCNTCNANATLDKRLTGSFIRLRFWYTASFFHASALLSRSRMHSQTSVCWWCWYGCCDRPAFVSTAIVSTAIVSMSTSLTISASIIDSSGGSRGQRSASSTEWRWAVSSRRRLEASR